MQLIVSLLMGMIEKKALQKLILSNLATKSPIFAKILKTGQSIAKLKNDIENVLKYIDPEYLLNTLLKLPKKEIQKYLQLMVQHNKISYKQAKIYESAMKGDLNTLKRTFNDEYATYMAGGSETNWVNFSSSWIQRGFYNQIGTTNNGVMTIFIRSDNDPKKQIYGPYIYPNIPIEVWTAMKAAKGKNGTGAGSVFWKMWLRKWLNSYLRDHTYKKLEQKYNLNSKTYSRLPNQNQISQLIREQQELVKKAQFGYYKSTSAKMAYQGFPSNPKKGQTFSQAKPFSIIDNPIYMQQRKLIQQQQLQELKQPIFKQQIITNLATQNRIDRQNNYISAKNNLKTFKTINKIEKNTTQISKGNLKPLTNPIIKSTKKNIKNKLK